MLVHRGHSLTHVYSPVDQNQDVLTLLKSLTLSEEQRFIITGFLGNNGSSVRIWPFVYDILEQVISIAKIKTTPFHLIKTLLREQPGEEREIILIGIDEACPDGLFSTCKEVRLTEEQKRALVDTENIFIEILQMTGQLNAIYTEQAFAWHHQDEIHPLELKKVLDSDMFKKRICSSHFFDLELLQSNVKDYQLLTAGEIFIFMSWLATSLPQQIDCYAEAGEIKKIRAKIQLIANKKKHLMAQSENIFRSIPLTMSFEEEISISLLEHWTKEQIIKCAQAILHPHGKR